MIVKTAKAREHSFELKNRMMVERGSKCPWYLLRQDLGRALAQRLNGVFIGVIYDGTLSGRDEYDLTQGKSQRGKKFIQIGCKRFVGVNRTRLIRWAKGAK
jgi:hypothetical protein